MTMSFGERLVELRKEKGYTRETFAEELGISKYTLRNYELSVNDPGSNFLMQISDFFNVSIDYLLCRTNDREQIFSYNLKSSEYKHIEKYRSLDTLGRETVNTVLDCEFERINAINDLKAQYEELKSRTVKRAVTYSNELIAAHERTDIDVTEEMKKHDDDIMNDDSEWE